MNPEQTCCPPRPRLGTGSPAGPIPDLLPAANTYPPADQQFPAHSWEVSGLRDRVYSPPGLGRRPQTGARLEPQRTQVPAYHTVAVLQACSPVRCAVRKAMFPRDGAPRGILLGFSTRRLCCLFCIRLTGPRLRGPPRAVRLDENNCEEGREEGQSEAAQPFKVTQWVEGLRSCSPGIPRGWLCSKAMHGVTQLQPRPLSL